MLTYSTSDGDVIDEIVWRHYGRAPADLLRQVIASNPGIEDLPAVLPAGVLINLPEAVATPVAREGVTLWS